MKERSSQKVGNILLNLLRLLYFPGSLGFLFVQFSKLL